MVFLLATGLVASGIVYGEDPLKTSSGTSTTSTGGMGWQEKTQRTPVMVTDGIRISTGPTMGPSGMGWSISFSTTVTVIECCKPTTLVQSWCNYSADDERCPD